MSDPTLPQDHFLDQSREKCAYILTTQKVEEAEQLFVLCDFHASLTLANEIIDQHTQQTTNIRAQPADVEERTIMKMKTPLCLIEKYPPSSHDISHRNGWNVSLTTDNTTSRAIDRASAVVIQCSYELYKQRQYGTTPDDRESARVFLNEKLDSVLRSYRVGIMPIDLVYIWIRFCKAVGCIDAAAFVSAELLRNTLKLVRCVEHGNLLEYCDDALFVLTVEILPYAKDSSFVKQTLDFGIEPEEWTVPLSSVLSKHPVTESVSLILIFLRDLMPKVPLMTDSGEECIAILEGFLGPRHENPSAKKQGSKHPTTDSTGVSHVAVAISNRSLNKTPKNEDSPIRKASYSLKRYVIDPLWIGECRWENRGRVTVAAYLAYASWKKRGRLVSCARSGSKALMAPILDILRAFQMDG